jgi:hypothetical protein
VRTIIETAGTPGGLTVSGLLLLVIVAIVRGWLATGREIQGVRDECERLRAERDAERGRADAARERVDALSAALVAALERFADGDGAPGHGDAHPR